MKKLLGIALVGLSAGCMQQQEEMAMSPRAETELAVALEGRVAGAPTDCVMARNLGNRSVGESVVLFTPPTRGGTLYVNNTSGGCPDLRARTLVVRQTTGRLCRGDIARVVDPVSGFETGSCVLGDFVPYRRR